MKRLALIIALVSVCAFSVASPSPPPSTGGMTSQFFSPAQWQKQAAFESRLNAIPDAQQLRSWHDLLASEPHVAGSDGDQRVIESMVKAFRDMGVDDVQVHEFWALLAEPVEASLEIVDGNDLESVQRDAARDSATRPARRGVMALPISEDNLLDDPYVVHPGLNFGWNAFSGSGDVTAGIVYANYGTKEDFETLKRLGVDCTGKIVLARYGGNFRGYKAKYAQLAGAIGLIIFTDPDDSGYRKGVTYPEGGWANDTCIQRGSILAIDQPGDPLTPGVAATQDAVRLDVQNVALPQIPVQPVGYRAAEAIMQRMHGAPLPAELIKTWQGGLPHAYRLTGGEDLRVRLMVKQNRIVKKSANVIATIYGETLPDERVYVGSHHDAWGYGAGDPTSGTILVMEAARSYATMVKDGQRPQRSIVFCGWGAEEFGLFGSTEFCEQFADDIREHAVAYINLDAATMGPNFGAASDPLLKAVIGETARAVPQARQPEKTVFDAWAGDAGEATIGNLGGGSDHVGFYCHLGVPSCFVSAHGAPGTAYHSNYDNLAWYRQTVGDDYEPALMLTRIVNVMTARLANAEVSALDPTRYAKDIRSHIKTLSERAKAKNVALDAPTLSAAVDRMDAVMQQTAAVVRQAMSSDDERAAAARMNIAALLRAQSWSSAWMPRWPEGMTDRTWFRNFYASSDPTSGYASWMFPELRAAIERGDSTAAASALHTYEEIILRLVNIAQIMDAESGLSAPQ